MLGVRPEDSLEAIRRAYRKAARAWHPDLHPDDPNAEERFKEVAAAWQQLSNPASRARWDQARGGASGGGSPTEGYAAALSDALQRAQDWLDRGVLPSVAQRWRGRGAEALASALHGIDTTARPGPLPRVGRFAARRAAALGRELNIALDPLEARPIRFLRHRRGWSLVFGAKGLERSVPESELDDVVMRLLVDTALRCLLAERLRVDPAHPEWLDEARQVDDAWVRERRQAVLLWATIGLGLLSMMTWAKWGTSTR